MMESDALLAQCALLQGDPEQARQLAHTVWRYLRERGTAGVEEALLTYLTLADVFEALADADTASPDAVTLRAVLQEAKALVMARRSHQRPTLAAFVSRQRTCQPGGDDAGVRAAGISSQRCQFCTVSVRPPAGRRAARRHRSAAGQGR
ncbi:MAG: hypothetical protein HZY76_23435 [Anaerolineae bacterium]|nr:MAG: hypothetical protein HZY76_23435 [Anaerolineae bacterium]